MRISITAKEAPLEENNTNLSFLWICWEKLKQIRKEKKLTQEQLGKIIGVQKAQISKLESGNNSATIPTVLKVFSALKAKVKFKIDIEEPGYEAR